MIIDAKAEKQWTGVFPADVVKESDSVLFLSRMTYIAFAEYLFNRGIVPQGAFNRRRIGGPNGVPFHTFNKTRWGAKLSDMLKGVGDAIKLKYARQAIIMINQDKKDIDLATEVFSVSFAYSDQDCLKITDEHGNVLLQMGYKDKQTFRKQVAYIIKKIALIGQSMTKIEGEMTPFIKLTYFDERTPPEYEPMHFKHCPRSFYFEYLPPKYEFGAISTSHASMLLDIKSLYIEDTIALEDAVLNAVTNEHESFMDTTADGDMTMADIDQQRTPSEHAQSPLDVTPIEFSRGVVPRNLALTERLSNAEVASIEGSEGTEDNDTTHEDKTENTSPQNNGKGVGIPAKSSVQKKPQPKQKSPIEKKKSPVEKKKSPIEKKKKSPVKKRVVAPRKAKKGAQVIDEDSDMGSSPVRKEKVSQRRVSPPYQMDNTPRDQVLEGDHFKASVFQRSVLLSPTDSIDYYTG